LRKALIHVGTHKTGTTSIQSLLALNSAALARCGIYVPTAGRQLIAENLVTPGHHDLASELMLDKTDALQRLIEEISHTDAPTIVLSSEEFHPLHPHPHKLAVLRDALASVGFETTIVVYLREQAGYIESLYSELSKKTHAWRFTDFFQKAITEGGFYLETIYQLQLVYSKLLAGFGDSFGNNRIIARAYAPSSDPHALLRDFLRVVAAVHGPFEPGQLSVSDERANPRTPFGTILGQVHVSALETNPSAPSPLDLAVQAGFDPNDPIFAGRFLPVTREEKFAIVRRFAADNAVVEARGGISIPGTREEEVAPAEDPMWQIATRQRRILDFMLDAWFAR